MKTCPSCGAIVPEAAPRCKECFEDLNRAPKGAQGKVVLYLVMGAIMAVIAALVVAFLATRPLEQHILVDEDTRSIVWTTKYRTGLDTKRLAFDQINKLEHVIQQGGNFEIRAVDLGGERHIVMAGPRSLAGETGHYADIMKKPYEEIDETGVSQIKPPPPPPTY